MKKRSVALIGLDPYKLDFSDPSYAPFAHLGAEATQRQLDQDEKMLRDMGYNARLILTESDIAVAIEEVKHALASDTWDCVLIGAGVRTIPKNFMLFEALVNLVHEEAPTAKICFNSKPDDTAAAVARWMDK
ncbi:hypothetical protein ACV35B_30455 [Pseudomonas aeruginosa]